MKQRVLTQYSSHAHTIADTFRAAFLKTHLGEFTVDMTAPEDSTKGGLLALQHVTLKSDDGSKSLVVGLVNAAEKRAELRAFSLVSRAHQDRFKKPPPFDEGVYKVFLEKAEPVLAAFGLAFSVTDTLDAPPPPEKKPSSAPVAITTRSRPPTIAIVGFALGAALIGAAIWLALR